MASRERELAFLRAAQGSDLAQVRALFEEDPQLLHAKSSSKGYTAMHYAAMGGSLAVIEWLASKGLQTDAEAPSGATPMRVALEYKRMPAARRLQQLRDAARPASQPPACGGTADTVRSRGGGGGRGVATAPMTRDTRTRVPAASAPPETARTAPPPGAAAGGTDSAGGSAPACDAPAPDAPAADLSTANRDAALAAFEAGERAVESGDLQRAVRYLRKAKALAPSDARIGRALADAERDLQAILKESMAERQEERERRSVEVDAANRSSGERADAPMGSTAKSKAEGEANAGAAKAAPSVRDEMRSSHRPKEVPDWMLEKREELRKEAQESAARQERGGGALAGASWRQSEAEREWREACQREMWRDKGEGGDGARPEDGGDARPAAVANWPRLAMCLRLLALVLSPVAAVLTVVIGVIASCATTTWRVASRRWDRLWVSETETHERLLYLMYYWRARLRWPSRLLAVIFLLLLAWHYPWRAYAVAVVGLSALLVALTPHMQWSAFISQTQAAAVAAATWLVFWLLPCTSAGLCALAFVGFVFTSIGRWSALGTAATMLAFYYAPSLCLYGLGAACWLLFLAALPKLCLFFTELGLTLYYRPFLSVWGHIGLVGSVFAYESPVLLVPLLIFLALFWRAPSRRILSAHPFHGGCRRLPLGAHSRRASPGPISARRPSQVLPPSGGRHPRACTALAALPRLRQPTAVPSNPRRPPVRRGRGAAADTRGRCGGRACCREQVPL